LVGETEPPLPNVPEPPKDFDGERLKTWLSIVRENPHLNYCGGSLLEGAVVAMDRARHCAKRIKEDGGPFIFRDGKLRRHPLAGLEAQERKLVRDIFKMLEIELREVE
jgi:hypothetical protein